MLNRSIKRCLAVVALLGCSLAMAQAEPTLNQVYEAAHAGKLDQAQVMMQQVLVAHPNSAKAHFVQAELSAQQGQAARAREELALAEKLAPGLPFAKPAAVQNLHAQLAAKASVAPVNRAVAAPALGQQAMEQRPASSPFPWGMVLVLGGAAVAFVVFLTRNRALSQSAAPVVYGAGNGLSGPQTFGAGTGAVPAYGQPGYGQPAGSGLGGQVMGGLATGLAVGAGVMAAQAIGKSLMGHDAQPAQAPVAANNGYEPLAGNGDLGGQDFGVADSGSWDDGGGGGGGDWDN